MQFEIKEFDYETFQQTIEYIHNGQCKLSYETIPGLICAAEVGIQSSLSSEQTKTIYVSLASSNTNLILINPSICIMITAL